MIYLTLAFPVSLPSPWRNKAMIGNETAILTLELRERLTITESLCLNLLWCIVFGPLSDSEDSYENTGRNITYRAKRAHIKKMAEMLMKKNWRDDEFAENRGTNEVQGMMELMQNKGWGTFEDVIDRVFSKILQVTVI